MIREMKTTAKIPVTLSGMVKAFGFTTAYALRIGVSEKEISLLSFRL
ncbi:hypothetical protein V529_17750 [Bacillus velezensis SQR9]|nr:hypothetical protein V529_17750 [Bacillus velezensis SQR9]